VANRGKKRLTGRSKGVRITTAVGEIAKGLLLRDRVPAVQCLTTALHCTKKGGLTKRQREDTVGMTSEISKSKGKCGLAPSPGQSRGEEEVPCGGGGRHWGGQDFTPRLKGGTVKGKNRRGQKEGSVWTNDCVGKRGGRKKTTMGGVAPCAASAKKARSTKDEPATKKKDPCPAGNRSRSFSTSHWALGLGGGVCPSVPKLGNHFWGKNINHGVLIR